MPAPELDLVEAAAIAHVGYHVMHGWALRGLVKAERRNGRWFVGRKSLEDLLDQRKAAKGELPSSVPRDAA